MRSLRVTPFALAVVAACVPPKAPAKAVRPMPDMARWVDPRIGTEGPNAADIGNTFPGAATPFGLVRLGPDSVDRDANAGYRPRGKIAGFSHLHVSGTGGGPKYGVILTAPTTGDVAPSAHASTRSDEEIRVGRYSVTLAPWSIRAELTTGPRVGYHRYTFPAGARGNVLFDLAHVLESSYAPESQAYVGGTVSFASPHELHGHGNYRGGWNLGPEYRVYFCALLEPRVEPIEIGTWVEGAVHPSHRSEPNDGKRVGAYFSVRTRGEPVELAVGISLASVPAACEAARAPGSPARFDAAREANVARWNEVLSRVEVDGATDDERTMLYTALYHAHLMPTDRTGDNPKWSSAEPYFDDYYAIWDTFRTLHPLLTLIQTKKQADMVRSLIDIQQHEGWMPDARSGDANGRTQGGSNADVVLADAFVKKVPGIDWKAGYAALTKDAEIEPPDPIREGRSLRGWLSKGYVTAEEARSGSRTVEYAYDDFAISEVARGLGLEADAARYAKRSGGWALLWDATAMDLGATGFVRPRKADGVFKTPFDPRAKGSWKEDFYEDTSWAYSLFVPHDVRAIVERSGGDDAFVRRLDALFDNGLFGMNDEPAFLQPYLYLWAGRPDRTALRVHDALSRHFHTGPTGLPGNDDAGAMSAWYVWSVLGIFPNAGQDVYLIGTPRFPRMVVHMESGRDLVVVAEGLDPERRRFYVQSATLDGRPLDRTWLRHAEIARGATLVFKMGAAPSAWGRASRPPSMSDPR